jgi:hypothetical protein
MEYSQKQIGYYDNGRSTMRTNGTKASNHSLAYVGTDILLNIPCSEIST